MEDAITLSNHNFIWFDLKKENDEEEEIKNPKRKREFLQRFKTTRNRKKHKSGYSSRKN